MIKNQPAMDTLFLLILLVALISFLIGVMDKVKFHFEQSWFSTVKNPKWLVRWLNPHQYLIPKAPFIIAWLLARPLAGLNDFWHFLKFLVLQLIFITIFIAYHETTLLVWLILCNSAYGTLFEIGWEACFNKPDKGLLTDPRSLIPAPSLPAFTKWYIFRFRSQLFAACASALVFLGVIFTKFNASHRLIGFITFHFVCFVLFLGTLHLIAWLKLRHAEKYSKQ